MYSVLQREIGQDDDRVCLEVGAKLFNNHVEGQCRLFETGVSSFCFCQGFAYEEYWSLFLVFVFFEQICTY